MFGPCLVIHYFVSFKFCNHGSSLNRVHSVYLVIYATDVKSRHYSQDRNGVMMVMQLF